MLENSPKEELEYSNILPRRSQNIRILSQGGARILESEGGVGIIECSSRRNRNIRIFSQGGARILEYSPKKEPEY